MWRLARQYERSYRSVGKRVIVELSLSNFLNFLFAFFSTSICCVLIFVFAKRFDNGKIPVFVNNAFAKAL
jgi:hypothetical protein